MPTKAGFLLRPLPDHSTIVEHLIDRIVGHLAKDGRSW